MSRNSESARERETFKYVPDVSQDSCRHDLSRPIPSEALGGCRDGALTAFAQLATFKLNASRAWISVFDREFQYVIAEATRSLSLDLSAQDPAQLRLCGTALPRADGICEHVLEMSRLRNTSKEDHEARSPLYVSVIPDITQDPRFQSRACMNSTPDHRFYAGVPIRSPRGIDIGVLCIFDDKARTSLDGVSIKFMCDLSRIIMEHLESKRLSNAARRNIRMIRGLGSFVEGYGSLRGWVDSNASAFSPMEGAEGVLNPQQQHLQHSTSQEETTRPSQLESFRSQAETAITAGDTAHHAAPVFSPQVRSPADEIYSGSIGSSPTNDPSDDPFLTQVKQVFSKAANIVRESLEVEGVLFLDASVQPFASLKPSAARKRANSRAEHSTAHDSSSSDDDKMQPLNTADGMCNVLGFSTSASSSIDGAPLNSYQINVPERMLVTLLRRSQSGEIFHFEQDGSLIPGDSDGSDDETPIAPKLAKGLSKDLSSDPKPKERYANRRSRKGKHSRADAGQSIIRIIPGARSLAIIPLWDSQKERWFASGLVWTRQSARTFTRSGEMSYLRAFGTTIMAEVSRTNTLISEKAKTDVLESMSHELRSPLHGIVAGSELLRDTQLDALQQDILHTLECCGRTLLDIIDHLLDYAKINRFRQSPKRPQLGRVSDRRESFEDSILSRIVNVDLSALTEESLESVYAGHNFQKMSIEQFGRHHKPGLSDSRAIQHLDSLMAIESLGNETDNASEGPPHLNFAGVSVYLDMDARANWQCSTQPGALRRIIMNLFGNSLKYTKRGFINITLRLERRSNHGSNLHITITDSGIGIGDDFLRHKLFTPFSQENQLTPGTGLGLSVVYRIVNTMKGTISVESKVNTGTTVKVVLPIYDPKGTAGRDEEFAKQVSALKGLRVDTSSVDAGLEVIDKVPASLHLKAISERKLVENLCREWLHMEVVDSGKSDIKADLMICSDIALNEVAAKITEDDILPPIVVICRNTSLAHEQSSSFRPTPQMHVAEFVSRPTGPRKMARALTSAFDRYTPTRQLLTPPPLPYPWASSPLKTMESSGTHIVAPETFEVAEPNPEPTKGSPTVQGGSTRQAPKEPLASGKPKEQNYDANSSVNVNKSYLLVDDNQINLKILAAIMGKLKHPYKMAVNGREALEAFSADPRKFCCILMDISMPVMDGLESTRRIRDLERKLSLEPVPIFALTGLASAETQKEAFASGIDIFLTKPVRFNYLVEHLAERGLR